jgi:protein SCO1/2
VPKIPHRTLAFGAILLALVTYLLLQSNSRESPSLGGTELIPAQQLDDFNLLDVYGRSFRKADILGKWTVLSFGFTRCPDVCPVTLATFRDELNALPLNSRDRIQFVFVTVDPEIDTPELLKTYVQNFHTAIRPVTGSLADLKQFAGMLSASFAKEGQGEVGLYTMAHSPQYFVINPAGQWQILYSPPLVKGRIAADLRALSRPKRFGVF